MNATVITRSLLLLAALAAPPLHQAAAQAPAPQAAGRSAPDLPALYARVDDLLTRAATALPGNPASALDLVTAAGSALEAASAGLPPALAEGGRAALRNARNAVARRSATDLSAQSLQARSVLARALYERLLAAPAGSASAAPLASALSRALRLGSADAATVAAAARAGQRETVRAVVEAHQARVIENALAEAAKPASRGAAFLAGVRAAAAFLVIQDSQDAGGLGPADFTAPLAKLAAGDSAAFGTALSGLRGRTAALSQGAARRKQAAVPAGAPAARPPAAATPTPPATAPAAGSTPPPAAGTTRPPAAGSPAPAATPPSRPATAAPAPLAPTPQPLNPRGRALAALDGVELQLAGAYALVADNRISDGRARALQAGLLFEQAVSPLLTRLDPPAAERASRLFASLEGGGLLAPDVGVLISEMERARAALNASTAGGARHELVAGLQPVWAGWLRGLLFILTCVLFAYPVYLMNLSFGGRNPHWRLVSAALLLLFVAPVLEGLAWLGPRLAETTGLASLEGAAALSILNNPLAQLAWAASLLLAVLLALAGFRGIASQFGLLGRRSAATTVLEAPAVALVGGRASGETIIEWDEEL